MLQYFTKKHSSGFLKKDMTKNGRLILSFTLFLMNAMLSSTALSASLNTRVDRTNISIDETLNLSITYSGDSKQAGPDLKQLETQFDILSRNQSSRVQYTNGSVSSSTEWSFTLGPKDIGKLIIPSFKVDGAFSDAIEIMVSKAAIGQTGSGQDLYIETFVDKDSVYVQEQIILTQRLYISANVNVDQLDPEELALDNVVLEELPGAKYTKKIGQKTYYIFEYSYAIFPQSSTDFVIPSLQWNLRTAKRARNSVFDRLGNYQIKRLRTQKKSIEVKPKPQNYPSSMPWLPAADIQLSQDWSKGTDTFKIGEPITRTITIEAKGLTSSQLPQFIKDSNSDGIKLYADQPQLNDEQTDNGVVGRRIESAAIVVTRNGEVTIPATRIPWWNTTKDRLEYLELDAKTLFVKGPEIGSQTNTTSAPNSPNQDLLDHTQKAANQTESNNEINAGGFWKKTAIFLLFTTLILLAMYLRELWLRNRLQLNKNTSDELVTNKNTKTSEKKLWKSLSTTLSANNYSEARKLLLSWVNSLEETQAPSLQQLNTAHRSADLNAAITGIDALLYADTSETRDSNNIQNYLNKHRELRLASKKHDKKQATSSLAPLHPSL